MDKQFHHDAEPDDDFADTPGRPKWRPGRALLRLIVVLIVAVGGGFVWFLSQIKSEEERPTVRADGIVVLTGGSSRVADAIDLLSNGYGRRLLISGVHWTNGRADIAKSLQDSSLLNCCVDLDRSAVNTRSNATETRRWARDRKLRSLIVVTSNYHMPRALVELSHAMPDVTLVAYPVIGDKWNEEPWWTSGAAARLLASEYLKYLTACVRVQFDRFIKPRDAEPAPTEAQSDATASVN
jgi:uncharacterized SAM-binding protein YcdF (DUF218 family)